MLGKLCGVVQRASLMWLWRDWPLEHPRRTGSSFFRRQPLWGSSFIQMLSSYWEWWSKTIRWGTEPHKHHMKCHTKSNYTDSINFSNTWSNFESIFWPGNAYHGPLCQRWSQEVPDYNEPQVRFTGVAMIMLHNIIVRVLTVSYTLYPVQDSLSTRK